MCAQFSLRDDSFARLFPSNPALGVQRRLFARTLAKIAESATIKAGFRRHLFENSTSRQVFVCSTGNQIGFMWRSIAVECARRLRQRAASSFIFFHFLASVRVVDLKFGNGARYYFGR